MPIDYRPPPAPRLIEADPGTTEPSSVASPIWVTYGPHPNPARPTERGIYLVCADAPRHRDGCAQWERYDPRVSYSGLDHRWLGALPLGRVMYRTTKVVVRFT